MDLGAGNHAGKHPMKTKEKTKRRPAARPITITLAISHEDNQLIDTRVTAAHKAGYPVTRARVAASALSAGLLSLPL